MHRIIYWVIVYFSVIPGFFTPLAFSADTATPMDETPTLATNHPCFNDFERFCKGKAHGARQAMACMHEHHEELTPECRKRQEERQDVRKNACLADTEKYCSQFKGNAGETARCLVRHKSELSPECRFAHPHLGRMKR
jgi:hypothetical protein